MHRSFIRLVNTIPVFRISAKAGPHLGLAHATSRRAGASLLRKSPAHSRVGLMGAIMVVLLVGLAMTGCSRRAVRGDAGAETAAGGTEPIAEGVAGGDLGSPQSIGGEGVGQDGFGTGGGDQLGGGLPAGSANVIYFAYDSDEVEPQYLGIVNATAQRLLSNAGAQVVLGGHTDERGSPEYNIALSERRAQSVARLLRLQGVHDGQIQIIPYGEEKPAAFGSDESAWRLNRRVELN